jgi:hypothetical protein
MQREARAWSQMQDCVFVEICRGEDVEPACVAGLRVLVRGPVVPGRPVGREPLRWWRRGDSTFHSFRCGLDYAFIRDTQ